MLEHNHISHRTIHTCYENCSRIDNISIEKQLFTLRTPYFDATMVHMSSAPIQALNNSLEDLKTNYQRRMVDVTFLLTADV